MGPLEAIRRRLELLAADVATVQRMLPPDLDQEVVDHVAQARLAVDSALAVFKKRDRDIRETFGFKR
jgi:hypothetical protein